MPEAVPIMSEEEERFMAFCGLIQWTQGVIDQSKRVIEASEQLSCASNDIFQKKTYELHCEQHYFVIAAYKLLEYRDWAEEFSLFATVDFSELDSINRRDIKDLRNMREHIVEYFRGNGRTKNRWFKETPEFKADASSCIGTLIGGRLDYIGFTNIAEQLLPELLKESTPYPSSSH